MTSGPLSGTKFAAVSEATAFARSVFPVPGGLVGVHDEVDAPAHDGQLQGVPPRHGAAIEDLGEVLLAPHDSQGLRRREHRLLSGPREDLPHADLLVDADPRVPPHVPVDAHEAAVLVLGVPGPDDRDGVPLALALDNVAALEAERAEDRGVHAGEATPGVLRLGLRDAENLLRAFHVHQGPLY